MTFASVSVRPCWGVCSDRQTDRWMDGCLFFFFYIYNASFHYWYNVIQSVGKLSCVCCIITFNEQFEIQIHLIPLPALVLSVFVEVFWICCRTLTHIELPFLCHAHLAQSSYITIRSCIHSTQPTPNQGCTLWNETTDVMFSFNGNGKVMFPSHSGVEVAFRDEFK